VRVLGVVPEARGRGIATWLLHSAFAEAAGEGRTAMTLTVDSENSTGATALYERAGMTPERVIVLLRRALS
jgi:ribosomal protein S18 acetylase RimI-like enzyme